MPYDVSSELKIALDLHDVLVSRPVFLHHLQDLDLQLELLVELIADLEDLQGVVPVVLVIQHLEHLSLDVFVPFRKRPNPGS